MSLLSLLSVKARYVDCAKWKCSGNALDAIEPSIWPVHCASKVFDIFCSSKVFDKYCTTVATSRDLAVSPVEARYVNRAKWKCSGNALDAIELGTWSLFLKIILPVRCFSKVLGKYCTTVATSCELAVSPLKLKSGM